MLKWPFSRTYRSPWYSLFYIPSPTLLCLFFLGPLGVVKPKGPDCGESPLKFLRDEWDQRGGRKTGETGNCSDCLLITDNWDSALAEVDVWCVLQSERALSIKEFHLTLMRLMNCFKCVCSKLHYSLNRWYAVWLQNLTLIEFHFFYQ